MTTRPIRPDLHAALPAGVLAGFLAGIFALGPAAVRADDVPADSATTTQAQPVSAAPAEGPAAPKALQPGALAPEGALGVSMPGVDGKAASIEGVKGAKGTLVIFTCNHCPYVKAWQDRMVAAGHQALDAKIGVIAINPNDPSIVPGDALEHMATLATEKKYRFPYVTDAGGKVARAFGATRTPEIFLLDADGRLVYHGAIDDDSENAANVESRWLGDALVALAAGKEIAVKQTKAIGCSIKFPKEPKQAG